MSTSLDQVGRKGHVGGRELARNASSLELADGPHGEKKPGNGDSTCEEKHLDSNEVDRHACDRFLFSRHA